jgi:membrane fusion protein (multidrug efflux system)
MTMKKTYVILGLLGVAGALGAYMWHSKSSPDMAGMMGGAPEVSVVTIKPEPLSLTQDLPGRTSAFRVAEIRPQVSGIIVKRFFEEGAEVTEGQQLYQIDAAPYQATYNSARADLAKAEANLKSVEAKAARYGELVKVGGISQQEFDDVTASLAQAKADIAIAKASVATAKINLNYTKVMSPISGRIGQSKVTEGALVNANQADALAVVQQLDKIYVDVSQSSEELLQLKQLHQEGFDDDNDDSQPRADKTSAVRLIVDGKARPEEGELKFSDITVNPTTGTVLLRAIFPNPNHDILPGMFVQARLEQWKNDNGILVSQKSVSRGADGSTSVWVVGADNKANIRPVSVTDVMGDKWVVSKGLQAGDKVILEGILKVQPGAEVKAVEEGAANTAPAAAPSPVSDTQTSPTQPAK